jgi:hypothetical protein
MVSGLALAGCAGAPGGFGGPPPQPAMTQPQPVPQIPATIRASEVIGRWGYASYHDPKDRARTEANARSQCTHPYVIGQGPNGGVMMYPADQSQLIEMALKGSRNGKNYIGPRDQPAGSTQDQEIVSFDGRVMILRYVDPEVAGRYGTGVYVRCAPKAASAHHRKSRKKR